MMTLVRRTLMTPADGLGTDVTFAAGPTAMAIFAPAMRPYRIIRWGTVITVAPVDTGSATLAFRGDIFPTPIGTGTIVATGATTSFGGASTGYNASNTPQFFVDTGGGTMTVPNVSLKSPAVIPIGSVIWHNVNPQVAQTGGYYPAPETAFISPGGVDVQLVIWPGQSFQITCTAVGSTPGHGKFFIDIEEQAFVSDFNNNPLVVSGYPNSNAAILAGGSAAANNTTPTPSWPFSVAVLNFQS